MSHFSAGSHLPGKPHAGTFMQALPLCQRQGPLSPFVLPFVLLFGKCFILIEKRLPDTSLGAKALLKQKPLNEVHILQAPLFEETPPKGRWTRGTYKVAFNIWGGHKTAEQFLWAISVVRNRDSFCSAGQNFIFWFWHLLIFHLLGCPWEFHYWGFFTII